MARRLPPRYEVRMRPEFAREHHRDQIVGLPLRTALGGGTLPRGVVIEWVDEPDGVTLVVEQQALVVEQQALLVERQA